MSGRLIYFRNNSFSGLYYLRKISKLLLDVQWIAVAADYQNYAVITVIGDGKKQ